MRPPGQKPNEITSCEYASRVTRSAPGRSGARLPEKRVEARSKLPQKKCTGLCFPSHPSPKVRKPAPQRLPEAANRGAVILVVEVVLVEGDGIGHLDRHGPDVDVDPQRGQERHVLAVEVADRPRLERQGPGAPVADAHRELVVDEVELQLEGPAAVQGR